MDLFAAYHDQEPLCFYPKGSPESARLIVAMVPTSYGIAVADANSADPFATKSNAYLEGKVSGVGPWAIGEWVIDYIEKHPSVEKQLDIYEGIENKPKRPALEEWLKEMA